MKEKKITIDKDFPGRKIIAMTRFDSPLKTVWKAFTDSTMLEKWFAPKPYKAVTESMDFSDGGQWRYYMLSPKEEKIYSLEDFDNIHPMESFEALDRFIGKDGKIDENLPQPHWKYTFSQERGEVIVTAVLSFKSEAEMHKILEMGFEQGFRMGLDQLHEIMD